MSISTHPGIRGITTPNPASRDVAGAVRERLDWLTGRHRETSQTASPRPHIPDSCREVVDTRTGVPRVTGNADSITDSGGQVGGRLSRLLTLAGARLHFDLRTRGMLAVLLLFVATIAAAAAWYFWPRPEPLPMAVPVAQTQDESETKKEEEVLVSVVGDVTEPGMVEVTTGARVADAIEAAGGLNSDVESAGYLNLARKVSDGEMIVVEGDSDEPTVPSQSKGPDGDTSAAGGDSAEPPSDAEGPDAPGAPVNLNQATADELVSLPGVGPVMAQRIIDYREQNGGFDTVDQLGDVDGIGPATLDKLAKLVSV